MPKHSFVLRDDDLLDKFVARVCNKFCKRPVSHCVSRSFALIFLIEARVPKCTSDIGAFALFQVEMNFDSLAQGLKVAIGHRVHAANYIFGKSLERIFQCLELGGANFFDLDGHDFPQIGESCIQYRPLY